uniref:Uncharacterized protein n=1 Tax=Hyaloperonospora arabidopsidis (strain Emoy2) TaxID=559515 RepID=M4BA84_HYAAE
MEETVDYGSDTSLAGDARTMSDTPMSEVHPPTPLGPFAERDEVIVTNLLDEQQGCSTRRKCSAPCAMVTTLRNQRDYVFTPPSVEEHLRQTIGQSLATWTIGPVAASAEEGASGQALCERRNQGRRRQRFIRCVHRTRRLSSMYALRASVSVADVRLERKLRYDYAKFKTRGQLCNRTRYASATTVDVSAGQTVTNTRQPTPLVVGNGLGLEMTLATMLKTSTAYEQSC